MPYSAITVEGGLFPADILDRIATGDMPGQAPKDFNQPDARRLTDEIQKAFSDLHVFRESFERQKATSRRSAVTLTREAWVLPALERLGFENLEYQRAHLEAGGEWFEISYLVGEGDGATPVEVVGHDQSLDRRRPPARRNPHAAVQEYLNRSDALWGIVTNGGVVRLLRDSNRVAHPTYLEFDLGAILRDNLYDEFYLLYRLLHRSRFPSDTTATESCLLETYYQEGLEQGGRVREHLRDGVEDALKLLGSAFLTPGNTDLRQALDSGRINPTHYYRQLLRLVYRLLFLLVVEERKILIDDSFDEGARSRSDPYVAYYSLTSLRRRAEAPITDDSFIDAWEGIKRVFQVLSGELDPTQHAAANGHQSTGDNPLGLSPLNGELFGPDACRELELSTCRNQPFLTAIRGLTTFRDETKVRRAVNFKDLDVEELGSVYESLLEYHPYINLESPQPFDLVAGSERKQTGSYYTPSSLVQELIKSALEPVLEDRLREAEIEGSRFRIQEHALPDSANEKRRWQIARETAILSIRVCDAAGGSGHFLLAAARRLARELATVRAGDDEPSPPIYRQALRDVIRQCIYAVDKNPLAVDLCKVALWIEGYNAGLPLSFLDNHIRCGDSLVGVFDLSVLEEGIPDGAYTPVTGDDKAAAAGYRKRNKQERQGQLTLGGATFDAGSILQSLAPQFEQLAIREERAPYTTRQKAGAFERLRAGPDFQKLQNACDLWTSAFFLPLRNAGPDGLEPVVTTAAVRDSLQPNPTGPSPWLIAKVKAEAQKQPFFHWPLEFLEVFAKGKAGGFDVVLGNPPWERIKLQEKEFFAARDPEIAHALNKAARDRLIKTLPDRKPDLAKEFASAQHTAESSSRFVRTSGRFPLCGRGDVNTYSVFGETTRTILGPLGRAGNILPTGIATDDTTKDFFADLMNRGSLASLYDFENKNIFPHVHSSYKFCLLTLSGSSKPVPEADFAFFLHSTAELSEEGRRFGLTAADIALVNPNTKTCPIFRTAHDAQLTKQIYRRVPVLIDENREDGNPWGIKFLAMFHMSNDSGLFRTREQLEAEGYRLGSGAESNVFLPRQVTGYAPKDPSLPNTLPPGPPYPANSPYGAASSSSSTSPAGTGLHDAARSDPVPLPVGDAPGPERETHNAQRTTPPRYLPLYEAKMLHQFDHRWATYDGLQTRDMTDNEKTDPNCLALSRYWVPEHEVHARLSGRWHHGWLLAFRNVCRSTDERTIIDGAMPRTAVGHSMPLVLADCGAVLTASLIALPSSFACDYIARQKVAGINMTFGYFAQFTVPRPSDLNASAPWADSESLANWNRPRILELAYTAWDMRAFAHDLGYDGPPFPWHPERRFMIRCELDAAFFHLYGIARDDVDYIMETFPIVERKDEARFDAYRTKDTILDIYDAMHRAVDTRADYRTRLDPPPADARLQRKLI